MASLDGQNGASSGDVGWIGDEMSRAKICADTDTFQNARESEKPCHIGVREAIRAFLNGCNLGG